MEWHGVEYEYPIHPYWHLVPDFGTPVDSVFYEYIQVEPGIYLHWTWLDDYFAQQTTFETVEVPSDTAAPLTVGMPAAPVPEASTYGMLLAGLLALGLRMMKMP